jgi:hypothetical protein
MTSWEEGARVDPGLQRGKLRLGEGKRLAWITQHLRARIESHPGWEGGCMAGKDLAEALTWPLLMETETCQKQWVRKSQGQNVPCGRGGARTVPGPWQGGRQS